mgnify:CR=1 FL=1
MRRRPDESPAAIGRTANPHEESQALGALLAASCGVGKEASRTS